MIRVGIVGGGQLGRMLALAGYPLDIRCTVLDPATDAPAAQLAPAVAGSYDDPDALVRLADGSDVITYEFENVGVEALRAVQQRIPVFPPPSALEVAQDRLLEKRLFEDVGLAVAPFVAVGSLARLHEALAQLGTPAVLKTRRFGYDGKGQAVIHDPVLADVAWRSIGEAPSIVESLVAFDEELSIVAVRGRDGRTETYSLVSNQHRDGILRRTVAPAPHIAEAVQTAADRHVHALMERMDYVGVLAVELFRVGEELLGNEMAPRVHNSGHWTIEGAETSQFENHLRAVCDLPLGPTTPVGHSIMTNLIGAVPDIADLAAISGAHVHLYGKSARPGRKLGHVTVRADDPAAAHEASLQVARLVDE